MALRFIGKDENSGADNCPAVFIDEDTGDFVFQGPAVIAPGTLTDVAEHSPIADNESVVRLPARMRGTIQEALNGQRATVQRTHRGGDDLSGTSGDQGRLRAV